MRDGRLKVLVLRALRLLSKAVKYGRLTEWNTHHRLDSGTSKAD